jgi:GNAT superfamily N-acetyltransferase
MIRRARPDEADTLSALAFRSKAHWGYDPVFMAACRDALTLTAGFIAAGEVYVMEVAGSALGFYSLTPWNSDLELFHFFIDPGAMGNGVGRRLWEDAIERAAGLGYSRILIQSDPYAEGFYLKLGAERIGEVPSAVQAGRVLPLLLFPLADGGPQEGGKR